jgi:hypothetical protein
MNIISYSFIDCQSVVLYINVRTYFLMLGVIKMKGYELLTVNYNEYKFLVLSTSFETPLNHINEITTELSENGSNDYKVIFDMLLSIGNTSERFVEAKFDGDKLNQSSFNYIHVNKKDDLRKISTQFLKENCYLLDNSVLNSYQKKMVSKGITI